MGGGTSNEIEQGAVFRPRFDRDGLIVATVTDAADGRVLMTGWMNRESLDRTIESGRVTFWSRSRQRLWTKGETSGNCLSPVEIRVDCDQDSLWIVARAAGPTCHTGARSCYYRRLTADGAGLEHVAE